MFFWPDGKTDMLIIPSSDLVVDEIYSRFPPLIFRGMSGSTSQFTALSLTKLVSGVSTILNNQV